MIALITSCSSYDLNDYLFKLNCNKDEFIIMDLSNIQIESLSEIESSKKYIKKNLDQYTPDLIVLNGDTFNFTDYLLNTRDDYL